MQSIFCFVIALLIAASEFTWPCLLWFNTGFRVLLNLWTNLRHFWCCTKGCFKGVGYFLEKLNYLMYLWGVYNSQVLYLCGVPYSQVLYLWITSSISETISIFKTSRICGLRHLPFTGWRASPILGEMQEHIPDLCWFIPHWNKNHIFMACQEIRPFD